MRIIKYIKQITFVLILSLGLHSCTNDFEEINTDPNSVSSETLENINPLLVQVQRHAFVEARYNTWRGNMILAGRFSEQVSFGFSGTWFGGGAGLRYDNAGWNDAAWDTPMGEVSAPLYELLVLTGSGGKLEDECTEAVLKIIKGFFYQRMTDQFGAVPYIEGGNGGIPKFETQEEVYGLIMQDLSDAINTLKSCSGILDSIADGDMVYQGDAAKWLAAGNTLLLRMALRSKEANGGNQSIIDEALTNPFIASSADNFKIEQDPSNADAVFNGYYSIWHTWGGTGAKWVASETIVNSFKTNNDPRLFGFTEPIAGGVAGVWADYKGGKVATKSTYSAGVPFESLSKVNARVWSDDTFPYITMTYAEAQLLQAEAKYATNIVAAQTHFEEAIRANGADWEADASAVNTYISNEPSAQLSGTTADAMQQIGLNRWYAAYTNGYEAWSVMRRFDLNIFPDKTYTALNEWADTSGGINNKMGKRLNYSQATKLQNSSAVQFAVSEQGADAYSTPLWWDVN
ncbi:SusD/RagB family nutrient-binding outer membrane lipoprotein [Tenacibaculum haliotis]|uniref:SusD/RagB family nutrient-binding outer membrane lipoprotein n=1 Tax=Tenacibaculum haliotis TaxID=1888914 RepID=UPI0021AEB5A6|nr:SusD/RagB family nutrient-binding outer membrane lipoprotein [Tenacibaculum haliotis]MCT4699500.1 SusD/RagB family nutrient-binding outer membrane lipoprotein [Tenacibaculum haliotis]